MYNIPVIIIYLKYLYIQLISYLFILCLHIQSTINRWYKNVGTLFVLVLMSTCIIFFHFLLTYLRSKERRGSRYYRKSILSAK